MGDHGRPWERGLLRGVGGHSERPSDSAKATGLSWNPDLLMTSTSALGRAGTLTPQPPAHTSLCPQVV